MKAETICSDFRLSFPNLDFELKDSQIEAISSAVDGNNTLALMPTGSGKSMIYWMSGLERGGTTIVVEPLISLMEEQAEKLTSAGHACLTLNSRRSPQNQMKELTEFGLGKITPAFIFVSPERLATDGYFEHVIKQRRKDISLLVVDEIHCVSQWGLSFRPFYRQIPEFLDRVFGSFKKWCPVLGLTATLNPEEIEEVKKSFGIKPEHIYIGDTYIRPEIEIHIEKLEDENEKMEHLWDILRCHGSEKTVVYQYRKDGKHSVTDLSKLAKARGIRAEHFHGDMSLNQRAHILREFKDGELDVLFATNAFGMGMDLPDIRTVVHFMVPESPEQYYQEIGRAGRDGHGANAYLLYTEKNIRVRDEYFIEKSVPNDEKLAKTYIRKLNGRTGYVSIDVYDDEDFLQCLPYYLSAELLEIVGKGFSTMKELKDVKDYELAQLYDSTKVKALIRTAKVNNLSPMSVAEKVYEALLKGQASLSTNGKLDKFLILDIKKGEISEADLNFMVHHTESRREHLKDQLEIFVKMLEESVKEQGKATSDAMHQAIGRYLGARKWDLGRTKRTKDGFLVRSKSEVIIADLISSANIPFVYEQPLKCPDGRQMVPDFTLYPKDRAPIFWEHLGMLSEEDYRQAWQDKKACYEKYFPGQLVVTYETGALAEDTQKILNNLRP